jgi:hypothetical protein
MRHAPLLCIALLISAPAFAQEPVGCDKFKWPMQRERMMLSAPVPIPDGGNIRQPLAAAYLLTPASYDAAKLPMPPTRAPKAGSNAVAVVVAGVPKPGTYKISLTDGAWIDVFQNGKDVKAGEFSGVHGCEGIRKSVKFDLAEGPFTIQLTGTTANAGALVITQE